MAKPKKPLKVKLIAGFLFTDDEDLWRAKNLLSEHFGKIDRKSPVFAFDFTDYYEEELGQNIRRQYVSFKRLVYPEDLAEIKLYTNFLEQKFAQNGKRTINIDPGYVDLSKLILATAKDATYRLYLKWGIYAQSTLFFKDKVFHPWEWTYPDYNSELSLDFFTEVRNFYKQQFQSGKAKRGGWHLGFQGILNSRWCILIMLFIALGPLALPFLWKSLRFKKISKVILTILVSLLSVQLTLYTVRIIYTFYEPLKRLFITCLSI